jgi:hypothetical protein
MFLVNAKLLTVLKHSSPAEAGATWIYQAAVLVAWVCRNAAAFWDPM